MAGATSMYDLMESKVDGEDSEESESELPEGFVELAEVFLDGDLPIEERAKALYDAMKL